ncbi:MULTISPECIES: hypothetical protein [unclassified Endozoicomonas]
MAILLTQRIKKFVLWLLTLGEAAVGLYAHLGATLIVVMVGAMMGFLELL